MGSGGGGASPGQTPSECRAPEQRVESRGEAFGNRSAAVYLIIKKAGGVTSRGKASPERKKQGQLTVPSSPERMRSRSTPHLSPQVLLQPTLRPCLPATSRFARPCHRRSLVREVFLRRKHLPDLGLRQSADRYPAPLATPKN